MNAKFFDLKQDKQDRMINGALKIFALSGYRHASTDDIVREAHISKGLLFHYFDSKIGVYSFLYDYCVRYMTLELTSNVDINETSYFAIRRQMEQAKLPVLKNYPYMQMFLNTCAKETSEEAIEAITFKRNSYNESLHAILSKADMQQIESTPGYDKLLTMLDYTLDSIMSNHFYKNDFDAEDLYKENLSYLDLVEKLFTQVNEKTDVEISN